VEKKFNAEDLGKIKPLSPRLCLFLLACFEWGVTGCYYLTNDTVNLEGTRAPKILFSKVLRDEAFPHENIHFCKEYTLFPL